MSDDSWKKGYFENIDSIGGIDLKDVLISFEHEPILFTCSDKSNNMYICLCSEFRYVSWWVLGRLTEETLIALKQKNIDIQDAFLQNEYSYLISRPVGADHESFERKLTVDLLGRDLLEKGVYLEPYDYL